MPAEEEGGLDVVLVVAHRFSVFRLSFEAVRRSAASGGVAVPLPPPPQHVLSFDRCSTWYVGGAALGGKRLTVVQKLIFSISISGRSIG